MTCEGEAAMRIRLGSGHDTSPISSIRLVEHDELIPNPGMAAAAGYNLIIRCSL
jgi:hypothetical protein